MQQVTLRGLDPKVEKEIRRIAEERRQSINQVIKEIVHKEFKGRTAPAESLKELAGGWSREEAVDFERAIQSCEQIDEDMWK